VRVTVHYFEAGRVHESELEQDVQAYMETVRDNKITMREVLNRRSDAVEGSGTAEGWKSKSARLTKDVPGGTRNVEEADACHSCPEICTNDHDAACSVGGLGSTR
jgi:hypothetical protein